MHKYDLAILIPARNEMFIAHTVKRLFETMRGNTQVLVGLDGQWAYPAIEDDPRLTVVFFPESIGQRAATNQLCRLTDATYVMKLDAHCEMDEGFDVKLLADMRPNMTVLPAMRNLHAFDWVCIGKKERSGKPYEESLDTTDGCGHHIYQSPTPDKCEKCGGNMERLLVWFAKPSPRSRSFRFDRNMHFQYFNEWMKKPEVKEMGELTPTLSAQGSCFMLSRERYWELNICDEAHGSWGQQGVEVALKSWESGGELIVNNKTWYAHMFRTQGGDFGFPYHNSGKAIDKAREYSKDMWINNKWDKAIMTLDDVLQKFYPVPDWHTDNAANMQDAAETEATVSKGIIFYTDNKLNHRIAHAVQNQLSKISYERKLPIVSASLKPMEHFGKNVYVPLERGMEAYFTQIISALEALDTEIVYFCEHDVIYHRSHFDFTPQDKNMFYYNQNFWRIRDDGFAVHWDANQVSGLVCYRDKALEFYKQRWADIQKNGFDRSYEPGGRDKSQYTVFKSKFPNIDVRHEGTLTKSKWSQADFRDKSTCVNWQESDIDHIEGWDGNELRKVFPH